MRDASPPACETDADVEAPPDAWPAWTDEHWETGKGPGLTDRQVEVLESIAISIRIRGYPPTFREIGDALGDVEPNCVSGHLKALGRKGWIRREEARARGIILLRGGVRRAPRLRKGGAA